MNLIIISLTIIYMQEDGIWNVIPGCYPDKSAVKAEFE